MPGRETPRFRSIDEPAPPRTAPPEAFIWVGRMAGYKRPEAFVALAERVPQARFWMVGDPPLTLRARAAALGNLELLAPRPRQQLSALLERAVAVVSTSRRSRGCRTSSSRAEPAAFPGSRSPTTLTRSSSGAGWGRSRAAMAGRPLVATDVAGNPDVLAPGGGLLVPLHDPGAITAALGRVITDAALRASLGAQAHRQAVERFWMQCFVDGHIAALEEAGGGPSVGPG